MAALLPITKLAIAKKEKSRVLNIAFRLDNALFEPCDRHNDFECRSRRILSLCCAIAEWTQLIFYKSVPFFRFNPTGKNIRIERGRAR